MRISRHHQADLFLVLLTILWGTSFPLVKIAMNKTGVFTFLTMRFLLAGAVMYPFLRKRMRQDLVELRKEGFVLGFWMFWGVILQTGGMKFTTASMSGFLTGTLVVMVPVLAALFLKSGLQLRHLAAAGMAFAGVFLMTRPDRLSFNLGDLMTLGCAFCFAMQMIYVQKYGNRENSLGLAFYQIMAVGVLALPIAALVEGFKGADSPEEWGLAVWAAVVCTALAFWLQCRYQPETTAQAAAIVYSLEPVFAAVFAFILLGESVPSLWGAGLILAGMVVAEWKRKAKSEI